MEKKLGHLLCLLVITMADMLWLTVFTNPINYSAAALKNARLGELRKSADAMEEYSKAWSILQGQLASFKGF